MDFKAFLCYTEKDESEIPLRYLKTSESNYYREVVYEIFT